jgi:tRNA threonylcarbamoyladenosine biosynthesis protein TsaE
LTVNHFDFYRITNEEQAIMLGLHEHINTCCISLVEWPERVPNIAKNPTYEIEIPDTGPTQRSIKIKSTNQ